MIAIKKYRRAKGLTQKELARLVGITQPYLNQLESGVRTNPSIDVISRIAVKLEVSLDELLKIRVS